MANPTPTWQKIRKRFSDIETWAKQGLSERQIILNLGIGKDNFYKCKREHPELAELIEKARIEPVRVLTNKLYERACGMKRTVKRSYVRTDPDGQQYSFVEKTETEDLPNVAAIHLLLKNWNKNNWSNDPVHTEIARHNAGMDVEADQQEQERITEQELAEFMEMQKQAMRELMEEQKHD